MKKRSLHKTNFSRENLGFEDEKRAANLEKVEESRVSVKSILPLFPLPWNFNKSRVRGVIEGRTNNPFPRSPLWENTVTDRSPGNRVTCSQVTWTSGKLSSADRSSKRAKRRTITERTSDLVGGLYASSSPRDTRPLRGPFLVALLFESAPFPGRDGSFSTPPPPSRCLSLCTSHPYYPPGLSTRWL